MDNGAGTLLHREFCNECGSPLLEYGVSSLPLLLVESNACEHNGDVHGTSLRGGL